jgi:hypothetical protein
MALTVLPSTTSTPKIRYILSLLTSGNWTVPAGVTSVNVLCVGGGAEAAGQPVLVPSSTALMVAPLRSPVRQALSAAMAVSRLQAGRAQGHSVQALMLPLTPVLQVLERSRKSEVRVKLVPEGTELPANKSGRLSRSLLAHLSRSPSALQEQLERQHLGLLVGLDRLVASTSNTGLNLVGAF